MQEIPSTSLPEPQQMIESYQEIIADGYDEVYVITLSAKLSGTFQTLKLIGQEFDDQLTVHMIDSKRTSFVMEYLVQTILALLDQEMTATEILPIVQQQIDDSRITASIEDLS